MAYFLGIDAGGTKAEYALADDTRELACVRGGSIKRMRVDAETAERHLEDALKDLQEQTGDALRDVTRVCVGTAGERVPLVTDWLEEQFAKRGLGQLTIVGDVEIALDAAFHGGPGMLVLAGTGANVALRLEDGSVHTAGGWGPLLGDDGSGYRIGTETLRALFRAEDEGRKTLLRAAVLAQWGIQDMDELVALVHRQPGPDFASLAQVTLRCTEEDDEVAQSVLLTQGEALGMTASRLLHRVSSAAKPLHVAFAGSIMEHVAPVREAAVRTILSARPDAQLAAGTVRPVEGALWLARRGGRV